MRVATQALCAIGSRMPSMTNCLSNALAVSAILLCTLLGGSKELSAQVGYKVGARLEGFPNPTGSGSRQLLASVYYPASSDGYKAPIIKKAGGLPVLVFLHGFGALGLLYPELAFDFARAGYVVILQKEPSTAGRGWRSHVPRARQRSQEQGLLLLQCD